MDFAFAFASLGIFFRNFNYKTIWIVVILLFSKLYIFLRQETKLK